MLTKKIFLYSALLAFPGSVLTLGLIGSVAIESSWWLMKLIFSEDALEKIRLDLWGFAIVESIFVPLIFPFLHKNVHRISFVKTNLMRFFYYIFGAWVWGVLITTFLLGGVIFLRS